jgi:hypothetical protein
MQQQCRIQPCVHRRKGTCVHLLHSNRTYPSHSEHAAFQLTKRMALVSACFSAAALCLSWVFSKHHELKSQQSDSMRFALHYVLADIWEQATTRKIHPLNSSSNISHNSSSSGICAQEAPMSADNDSHSYVEEDERKSPRGSLQSMRGGVSTGEMIRARPAAQGTLPPLRGMHRGKVRISPLPPMQAIAESDASSV